MALYEAHCKGIKNLSKDKIEIRNEHYHGPSDDNLNAKEMKENAEEQAKSPQINTKQLAEDCRSISPLRVPLGFHYHVQPSKKSIASKQRQSSTSQSQKC